MNRILKIILITLGCIITIFVVLVIVALVWFNISVGNKKKQAEADYASQSVICDTIQNITGHPQIGLYDFDKKDISELRFSLLRDGSIVADTLILNRVNFVEIPFTSFLKTDTILIKTKNELCYFVTGYKYKPYLGYGMFGYVGHKECRLSDEIIVNGQEQSYASLLPEKGIKSSDLPVCFK